MKSLHATQESADGPNMQSVHRRCLVGVFGLVAVLSLLLGLLGAPASAAALASATWTPASTAPSDTGVRYTWTFKTASAGSVSSVTFTVPAGTIGTSLTAGNVFGIGASSSIALNAGVVTYTVASPANIPADTTILISVDGFTNTTTPGTYTSSIATNIDTALASPGVVFNPNTAVATFTVQHALSLAANASSVQLSLDPGGTNDATSAATVLTIKTNANGGYTLQTSSTPLQTPGGAVLAPVSAGVASPVAAASFTTNRWGYSISALTNGAGPPVNGVLTPQGGLSLSTNYVGFTAVPETAVIQTGPTNGDTVSILTRAKIDLNQPAGVYTSQVRYTVAATY